MSFKVQTPYSNPFDAAIYQAKSCFFGGLVCGLFVALGICQIASWDGWRVESSADPPPSKGALRPDRPNPPANFPPS